MEIYKILDRFELIGSTNEGLADLRRAYIDCDMYSIFKLANADDELRKAIVEKNIHSIFRCVDNKRIVGDLEDLRKAVLDQNLHSLFRLLPGNDDLRKAVVDDNLHSIFRLIEHDDLKSLILNDNIYSLWRLLQQYIDTNFIYAFKFMNEQNIEFDEDCFSRGQLRSKLWLVHELKKIGIDLGVVFLCAGWYGTLATMLFESGLSIEKIRSFDIDETTKTIAEIFNRPWVINNWKFKPVVQDIRDINFREHAYIVTKTDGDFETLYDSPDTIINTSCEHIDNFEQWYDKIPEGKFVVMQCNDFKEIKEHVNTHDTLESFAKQTPLTVELYSGELGLGTYKRFMRIGYR
jgi:hypothetical protein